MLPNRAVQTHRQQRFVFITIWILKLASGHRDNLWLLGGEIIRDINETPKLRTLPVGGLIREVIANDEGPLIHGGFSEQEQRSFDSTCRRLNRFLAAHADSQQR